MWSILAVICFTEAECTEMTINKQGNTYEECQSRIILLGQTVIELYPDSSGALYCMPPTLAEQLDLLEDVPLG